MGWTEGVSDATGSLGCDGESLGLNGRRWSRAGESRVTEEMADYSAKKV